ncbi:MAG: phenylalanine--tRNA ligase subunit alpha, partial [Chlamydiia bacterium]|nr:phenylalanine--tRNA ligase subunit alpha [Chlamydiia bacterium]
MKKRIQDLKQSFLCELKTAQKTKELEELRVKYLGKKSPIQALMQDLRSCAPEERPEMGKLINTLKQE